MAIVAIRFSTPIIIFGEDLYSLLCSYLLSNILILCKNQTEDKQEDAPPTSVASDTKKQKWSIKNAHGTAKIGYIWEYYKLPIAIICIFLYIAGYMIHGSLTHKDTVLYTAFVNVSASDSFTEELYTDFLDYLGANTRKEKVELYDGLYLTEDVDSVDRGYVYASNTKIAASIASKHLDLVLIDKTAFDIFSKRGYLCNIEELLVQELPNLYNELQTRLINNTVIVEDNSTDVQLDPSIAYTAVTDEYPMAIDISQSKLILKEEFDGTLYMGIISNAPHTDTAVAYLKYLTDSK